MIGKGFLFCVTCQYYTLLTYFLFSPYSRGFARALFLCLVVVCLWCYDLIVFSIVSVVVLVSDHSGRW